MTGKVVHFELPADDVERARAFYTDAFGWQLDDMPELDYIWVLSLIHISSPRDLSTSRMPSSA